MSLYIVQGDITKMQVDAIVNAANTGLKIGGGVCGAIYKAAGACELERECKGLSPIKTGQAVVTSGYNLFTKYIIHTAGPIYNDWINSQELLKSCYLQSLCCATNKGCKSIAFPLISSGIYGYPTAPAIKVAISAIREYLTTHNIQVYLVLFDTETFALAKRISAELP